MKKSWEYKSIHYLKSGTQKQIAAYATLSDIEVISKLAEFTPVLAGTVPLDIDVDGSDLDIICQSADLPYFQRTARSAFGNAEGFEWQFKEKRGVDSLVCNFFASGFEIELFCQNRPVEQQYGVIHMLIEHRLLELAGEDAKSAIRDLKKSGLKTEPAFCKYFNIAGDPYEALISMAACSDAELRAVIEGRFC